jgi:hypothetical protein
MAFAEFIGEFAAAFIVEFIVEFIDGRDSLWNFDAIY